MESPCRLGVLLLCLSAVAHCQSSLRSEIREMVGLGSPSSAESRPGAVIVFIKNASAVEDVGGGNVLDEGDLLEVAAELEERDRNAIFLHYDGDNLITSQTSLFNDIDSSQEESTWTALLEKVKSYRRGKAGSYSDLLVFQLHPDGLQNEVAALCDGMYGNEAGKCQIVDAYVKDGSSHARYRRAEADPVTTPAPPLTPAQRANIPLDSVAAFHLLFWTSLAIALTVWGFAYGMWHMDPGRDSIIYRMTSAQKFKKDK